MGGTTLLVACVFLWRGIVTFGSGEVAKHCSTNCSGMRNLSCEIKQVTGMECDSAGLGSTPKGTSPPRDLQAQAYYLPSQDTHKLNISWKLPNDPSFRDVQGFQIKLLHLNGDHVNINTCYHFNLGVTQWTDKDSDTQFSIDCIDPHNVHAGDTLGIQVYSLPKPQVENKDSLAYIRLYVKGGSNIVKRDVDSVCDPKLITKVECLGSPGESKTIPEDDCGCPGDWKTSMTVTATQGSVEVKFLLAPPVHRFTSYSIQLVGTSYQEIEAYEYSVADLNQTEGSHTFMVDRCEQETWVWIRPVGYGVECQPCKNSGDPQCKTTKCAYEPFHCSSGPATDVIPGKSTLWVSDMTTGGYSSKGSTEPWWTASTVNTGKSKLEPGDMSAGIIVAICFGVLGGISASVVLVACLWFRNCKKKKVPTATLR